MRSYSRLQPLRSSRTLACLSTRQPKIGTSCLAVMLFTGFLAMVSTADAAAEERSHPKWTIGVGGGVEDQYSFWTRRYSFGTFSESMEAGWFVSASVQRTISSLVSFRGEGSYLRYTGEFPVASIGPPAPRGVRVAEIPAVAFGLRLQSGSNGSHRGSAYFDLLPAVFIAHWTEGVKYGDDWGPRERKTKIAPGIVLGAGMRVPLGGRTSVEFGPRFIRTGTLGWTQFDSFFTPEEPRGLSEFGLSVGVNRAL